MDRRSRMLVGVPSIAVLAVLSFLAARWGAADAVAYGAAARIDSWAAKRVAPGIDSWMAVRADLEEAQRWARTDPQPPELLGLLHLQRPGGAEHSEPALEHFRRALELRPSSPYTWANVAEARYRLGMTEAPFERILVLTQRLGPSEPETQRLLAELGLAMWDEIGEEARAAVKAAVTAGMRRNPLEILQISERRGKLGLACSRVPGDKRLRDTKWTKVCGGVS